MIAGGEGMIGEFTLRREALSRGARMLRTALGPAIAGLARRSRRRRGDAQSRRPALDRPAGGRASSDTGERLAAADGERIVRLVAHHVGAEVHAGSSARLGRAAGNGRAVRGPAAAGRRGAGLRDPQARRRGLHARRLCRRRDHVRPAQADVLRHAVAERRTSWSPAARRPARRRSPTPCSPRSPRPRDRVVLIEDTRELQCARPNLVALRTKDGVASLSDLVRSSLRLRPDRIPIGEVRGAEALDLLKAWGTGHPGGIGTIHAGSALGALRRLEQLIQEAVVTVPRALIAETIDLIAVLAGPRHRAPACRARARRGPRARPATTCSSATADATQERHA